MGQSVPYSGIYLSLFLQLVAELTCRSSKSQVRQMNKLFILALEFLMRPDVRDLFLAK